MDFLVRGWDGITTHASGLYQFIRRFGSGPNTSDQQRLHFRFVYFQPRRCTGAQLQDLFGHPGALPPNGPTNRWWNPPPLGNPGHALEIAMKARVHPPVTHQDYLRTMLIAPTDMQSLQRRSNSPTLAIFYVLSEIDRCKTTGGLAQGHTMYNRLRNWFAW